MGDDPSSKAPLFAPAPPPRFARRKDQSRGVSFVGKQTASLWQAHEAAKGGAAVVFVCIGPKQASHALNRLRSMGFGCKVELQDRGRKIVYPSGGTLTFDFGRQTH